ncbi:hypothetical protein RIF29_24521 [Crotalaria pallida]|uniref:Uncharacterized protein n=1 Tax=Crotalaria pallida TaxID=3830 RepID=A0AAN9EJZ2_CROPI
MGRKRGRPPKTPVSSSKTKDDVDGNSSGSPEKIDLSQLEDDDLEDIDNLNPKQAELWIQKIDILRAKIKEKASNPEKQTPYINKDLLINDKEENEHDAEQSKSGDQTAYGHDSKEIDRVLDQATIPDQPSVSVDPGVIVQNDKGKGVASNDDGCSGSEK